MPNFQSAFENSGTGHHRAAGSVGHADYENQADQGEHAEKFVSRSVSWHERVGTMSVAMAKAICTDSQMSFLGPESLGLLVRIHALNRIGRKVPADLEVAARILGMSRKKLEPALQALMTAAPGFLNIENALLTVPTLGIEPASVKTMAQNRYRDSALTRWRDFSSEIEDGRENGFSLLTVPRSGKSVKSRKKGSSNSIDSSLEGSLSVGPARLSEEGLDNESDAMIEDGVEKESVSTKKSSAKIPPCPYQVLGSSFNDICKSLSNVKDSSSWTPVRKSAMNNRWKERPDVAFWSGVFADVQRSDFLTGRQTAWRCGFDWIIKPANLQKILEGNFSNRGGVRRALWDQGDKTRNSDLLAGMHSEVDNSAPFMRAKPQEGGSSEGIEIQPAQGKPDSSAIATMPFQNAVPAQRAAPSGGAGQAPAGFGLKQVKRVVPATPQRNSIPLGSEPAVSAALTGPVKTSLSPAAGFTPDQLRESIRAHKPAAPEAKTPVHVAGQTSEKAVPAPSVGSVESAKVLVKPEQIIEVVKISEQAPEKRTFRFRSAEQKGS